METFLIQGQITPVALVQLHPKSHVHVYFV